MHFIYSNRLINFYKWIKNILTKLLTLYYYFFIISMFYWVK